MRLRDLGQPLGSRRHPLKKRKRKKEKEGEKEIMKTDLTPMFGMFTSVRIQTLYLSRPAGLLIDIVVNLLYATEHTNVLFIVHQHIPPLVPSSQTNVAVVS